MAQRPRILYVRDDGEQDASVVERLRETYDVTEVGSPLHALNLLTREAFSAVDVASGNFSDVMQLGRLLQGERILEGMPDGVAMLDVENYIVWANDQLRQWCRREDVTRTNFYSALDNPEILGPDFCPFHTAL